MDSSIDLCQIPAGPSPDGKSNFDDPTSLAPTMVAIIGITVAWAFIFTSARFYVNIRKLGWSDYFNVIALAISIAILGMESTQLKAARHIWDLPACYFDDEYARGIYIPAILLQMGSFFAKASIFLLFLQIFMTQRAMRVAIWIGMTFNFVIYWSGVAIATYYETPRTGEPWTAILDGRTLIPLPWWQAQSALSIVLDAYIFILPLPIIAKLQLPLTKRIQLIAVFSLALMGIGTSIASLAERILITHANDTTWISAILSLCSCVELNVAIIVSSAPAFSSFARSHLSSLSVVKMLLYNLSYHKRSRSYDSEAAQGNSGDRFKNYTNNQPDAEQNCSHRYYELNDTWMLKSAATADQEQNQKVAPAGLPDNNIVRGMQTKGT